MYKRQIQGFGMLRYQALMDKDYALIMGTLLLTSFLMVLGNLLSDIIVAAVDVFKRQLEKVGVNTHWSRRSRNLPPHRKCTVSRGVTPSTVWQPPFPPGICLHSVSYTHLSGA